MEFMIFQAVEISGHVLGCRTFLSSKSQSYYSAIKQDKWSNNVTFKI